MLVHRTVAKIPTSISSKAERLYRFLQLTSSNYESMQRQIRFNELAKNFQDAILITRALSIGHVWIDELCILQDSPQDCSNEAFRRLQYFANSELNIAATASPDAQQGILNARDIARHSITLISNAERVGIRPLAQDVFSLIRETRRLPKRPPISVKPLNIQSHTFLERITARRTVHFTEQQMIWQCQTTLVGEDGQIGEDRDRFSGLCSKSPFDFHLGRRMREITGANENEHHRYPDMAMTAPVEGHTGVRYSLDEALMDMNWYELVGQFTKISVSDPSDVLPLLSPFANTIQQQTHATYLAGLWALDDQIPFRSLLWYCKDSGSPANNGSPSWTWSSVIGAITHPAQHMYRMDHPGARSEWLPPKAKSQRHVLTYPCKDSQIRITTANTNPTTSDIFGRVNGGELKITGFVRPYTGAQKWDFDAEQGHSGHSGKSDSIDGFITGSRKTFSLRKETDDDEELPKEKALDERLFTLTEYLDTRSPTSMTWDAKNHLLLLVAEFRDELDSSRKPHITPGDCIQFIILERRADDSKLRYARLGTAKLQRKNRDWGMMSGLGLWGVHSAYTEENGWKREELVLV
ncbi:MAG: hypothetical protein Q9170_004565 [Blastenia crenularia]